MIKCICSELKDIRPLLPLAAFCFSPHDIYVYIRCIRCSLACRMQNLASFVIRCDKLLRINWEACMRCGWLQYTNGCNVYTYAEKVKCVQNLFVQFDIILDVENDAECWLYFWKCIAGCIVSFSEDYHLIYAWKFRCVVVVSNRFGHFMFVSKILDFKTKN